MYFSLNKTNGSIDIGFFPALLYFCRKEEMSLGRGNRGSLKLKTPAWSQ
jgi:hypothetical protein